MNSLSAIIPAAGPIGGVTNGASYQRLSSYGQDTESSVRTTLPLQPGTHVHIKIHIHIRMQQTHTPYTNHRQTDRQTDRQIHE